MGATNIRLVHEQCLRAIETRDLGPDRYLEAMSDLRLGAGDFCDCDTVLYTAEKYAKSSNLSS